MFDVHTAWEKTCNRAWDRCKSLPRQDLMLARLKASPAWRRVMRGQWYAGRAMK